MLSKIRSTTEYIRNNTGAAPEVGIILGTGLGGLADEIDAETSFPYNTIPEFPVSTVQGHRGKLIFGKLEGKPVVAMQGRFHYYEGYSMQELTFPIRVMNALGVKKLFLSNASGGVNPEFEIGDIMLINDHINLFPSNPLIGPNQEELGPRFLDMSRSYDPALIKAAHAIAGKQGITVREGVYAAIPGPCFETPAEYRYMRTIGADAIGMSTIPEVLAARHMDMTCFAVSVITDLGVEGRIEKISHEKVQAEAAKVEYKMTRIMKELVHQ